ncbi:hypothetical protein BD413DRAFT_1502 [Trametes elegans]|nr:hypothetical protein BD413DRAFT_1502 [Trametes elegans]
MNSRPHKQSMSELKLRRLTEHNQRLREDLARPRIRVSEASASLIRYCKTTKDPLVRVHSIRSVVVGERGATLRVRAVTARIRPLRPTAAIACTISMGTRTTRRRSLPEPERGAQGLLRHPMTASSTSSPLPDTPSPSVFITALLRSSRHFPRAHPFLRPLYLSWSPTHRTSHAPSLVCVPLFVSLPVPCVPLFIAFPWSPYTIALYLLSSRRTYTHFGAHPRLSLSCPQHLPAFPQTGCAC